MKFRITQTHGRCLVCRKHAVRRIHRSRWMRVIPGSKYLRCHDCGAREFVVFAFFSVVMTAKKPHKKSNPAEITGLPS